MNFRRFINWLREIFLWAYEARLAFRCLIVLLMAFFIGFYMWPTEQSIRTYGFGLQIIGMWFAIRGLLKIRTHFDQPKLRKLSIAWLCRFPRWINKTFKIGVGGGSISIKGGVKAILKPCIPDNPEDSLKKRIDGIVKNQGRLKEEQKNISEQIDKIKGNQEKNQKEQKLAIVNMENQIRSDSESLHTDDILLSFIGLVWLTFGISMSTMSQELSKIFQ